jgi:hypothetical protein
MVAADAWKWSVGAKVPARRGPRLLPRTSGVEVMATADAVAAAGRLHLSALRSALGWGRAG